MNNKIMKIILQAGGIGIAAMVIYFGYLILSNELTHIREVLERMSATLIRIEMRI